MKPFIRKVANKIAQGYLRRDQDPTQALVKVAKDHRLNAHQIERVAAQTNRNVITDLQKQAVSEDEIDPHFVFPRIDPERVLVLIHTPEGARASAPNMEPRGDIDQVLPPIDDPMPEAETTAEEVAEDDELAGLEDQSAHKVLFRIKEKVDAAERVLDEIEFDLEMACRSLSKEAEVQLLRGTPIEVLEQIGSAGDVFQKVARQLHEKGEDVTHDDTPFEIETRHPLVKKANKIERLRDKARSARNDVDYYKEKAQYVRHHINRS